MAAKDSQMTSKNTGERKKTEWIDCCMMRLLWSENTKSPTASFHNNYDKSCLIIAVMHAVK